jgi:hypothetical protein
VDISDAKRAEITYEASVSSDHPVEGNVVLLPHVGEAWQTASGKRQTLGEESFRLSPGEAGDWFAHHGWRISVPPTATILWPALPHNPYRKDGRATAREGRIVMILPFDENLRQYRVTVELKAADGNP